MEWLFATCASIGCGLLIRAGLRAVVAACEEDGRYDGVVVRDVPLPTIEQDVYLARGEPHCVPPGRASLNGAPNSGRGTIGLKVGG